MIYYFIKLFYQMLKRVNSPNFFPTKLSCYTVTLDSRNQKGLFNKIISRTFHWKCGQINNLAIHVQFALKACHKSIYTYYVVLYYVSHFFMISCNMSYGLFHKWSRSNSYIYHVIILLHEPQVKPVRSNVKIRIL